eukprot:6110291-Amphidinium_carterae.1
MHLSNVLEFSKPVSLSHSERISIIDLIGDLHRATMRTPCRFTVRELVTWASIDVPLHRHHQRERRSES